MRIGVVTTSFPRWPGDMAGAFVEGHVRALVELGHEVEVVAAGALESDGGVRGGDMQGARGRRDARGGDMQGARGRRDARGGDMQGARGRRDARGGGRDARDGELQGGSGRRDGDIQGERELRDGDIDRRARDAGADYRVDLREAERREHERRERESDEHEVDLRDQHRRERERREHDLISGIAPRIDRFVTNVARVRDRGLFYRGGAPDLIERSPLRSLVAAASFMPRFARVIAKRARNWDHIIAHWLPCAIAALPARKPITAIAHGGDIHTLRRMRLLAPTMHLLRNARLVFVSDQLRELAGVDGVVQPMGIDLDHFAKIGRAPTSPPTILVAARLVPIKGVDVAIEAASRLDARLVIAGDGPERRALEARALANAKRGARGVTFLGEVDTQRRDRLLREASVVVVASRTLPNGRAEGCPTIALEALAAGVPVVATIGRANEIVEEDDPIAMANAIAKVIATQPSTHELVRDLGWRDVAMRLLSNE